MESADCLIINILKQIKIRFAVRHLIIDKIIIRLSYVYE